MGLQARLLLGLAVLVFVAIGSAGWLTVRAARGALEGAEEARARGLGVAAAGLLSRTSPGAAATTAERDRLLTTAHSLLGLGGITDVTLVDGEGRAVVGQAEGDRTLGLVLGGGGPVTRRQGETLWVYAPLRSDGPGRSGALRLAVAVGENLDAAVGGSWRLLAWITLLDGLLILLFGALFVRQVAAPLEAVARAAERIADGDLDAPAVPDGPGEVGRLARSFNRMSEALRGERASLAASRAQVVAQEKLATVGRLAAGVAHEIGNPLTAVIGFVELLLADEPPSGMRRELLERVRGETTRIHRIVHELVDYARPVGDSVEEVALPDVVAAAVALVAPQPRAKGLAVEVDLPPSLPTVAAAASRLLQVFLNLLLNAADAVGGQGRLRLTAKLVGELVFLDFHDSGPGVPEADRGRIFDPFFSTKEPGAGSGLGLAVCRSILQAYGGDVTLLPTEPGACFRVTLRRFAGDPGAAPTPPRRTA